MRLLIHHNDPIIGMIDKCSIFLFHGNYRCIGNTCFAGYCTSTCHCICWIFCHRRCHHRLYLIDDCICGNISTCQSGFCQCILFIVEQSSYKEISLLIKRILKILVAILLCYIYFDWILIPRCPTDNLFARCICDLQFTAINLFRACYINLTDHIGCLCVFFYCFYCDHLCLCILILQMNIDRRCIHIVTVGHGQLLQIIISGI